MRKSFVCTTIVGLAMMACSTPNQKTQTARDKFQVTQPVAIDTMYHSDYVSDIHSVKNVEIRARVKGYIESIHVDEGKSVKKGQVIFRISNQEYKGALLRTTAALKSAIAEAKTAELDLQNVKKLVDKNVVSKTELDMAKAKLDALNARVEQAESEEQSAKLNLSYAEIKAPFDGIIDRIPNKIGSLIDEGTLLTTLSDNNEVYAYFNVSEKEYLEFASGSKEAANRNEVSLILANNEEHSHKGFVETIEGEFDNATGSIAFRARFPNPERILKHGSSGKVRILKKVRNALVIPQKSTFEIQDKIYVYVIDNDNKVQMRSFVPKLRIPHLYILESGLSMNDKIIYEGIQDMKVGMQIDPEMVPLKKIINQLERQ
ncbi:efflux RND transporter periplasmic adaptor subunit [Runella sp.]|uniref:efflux RND transporter periplasmic adaptor subunit n=1 Tax=Runella sp. TaxID=1960881 RepID=UPI003D097E95